eukprot:g12561.t1
MDRRELFMLVFSADFVDAHDPRMLGTKIMRTTCANALALLNDQTLVKYVVHKFPLGSDGRGFTDEDLADFKQFREADKTLEEKLGADKWPAKGTNEERRGDGTDADPPWIELVWCEKTERLRILRGVEVLLEVLPAADAYHDYPSLDKRATLRKVACMSQALRYIYDRRSTTFAEESSFVVYQPQISEILSTGTCTAFWGLCTALRGSLLPRRARLGSRKRTVVICERDPEPTSCERMNKLYLGETAEASGFCEIAGRDLKLPKRKGFEVFFDFKKIQTPYTNCEWVKAVQKAYEEDVEKRKIEEGKDEEGVDREPGNFDDLPATQMDSQFV